MINKEIQKFDNIRTAVGLASSLLPIGRGSVKMVTGMVGLLTEAVGGSPLVLPANKLYDLRGPIKLSKVSYQKFSSKDIAPNGKRYYRLIEGPTDKDTIIIKY